MKSLLPAPQCGLCPVMLTRQLFPLGIATLEQAKSRERLRVRPGAGWLTLERCHTCGEHWFVAEDQIGDRVFLQRLNAQEVAAILEKNCWPETFDGLDYSWPRGPLRNWPPPGSAIGRAFDLLFETSERKSTTDTTAGGSSTHRVAQQQLAQPWLDESVAALVMAECSPDPRAGWGASASSRGRRGCERWKRADPSRRWRRTGRSSPVAPP